MVQKYVKKPEYLDVIEVQDDSQSIKEVYALAGAQSANVAFDGDGNRIITLEDGTQIPVGVIVFKDKKSGKVIVMPKDKLLQFYDEYNEN